MDRLELSWNSSSRGVCFQCSLDESGTASGPPSAVLEKGQRVLIFFASPKGPADIPETGVVFTSSLNPVNLV